MRQFFTGMKSKVMGGAEAPSTIVDEHFEPGSGLELEPYLRAGDTAGVHHLLRYLWARTYLATKKVKLVFDLGSGSGYGSYLLAKHLPDTLVVGVDYDEKAVERSQGAYRAQNLVFRAANLMRWDRSFLDPDSRVGGEALVCFDVLEHIEHREVFMRNTVEQMSSDAELLLSTPCGWVDDVLAPDWEFHRIEYSSAGLYDFLSRYFGSVKGSDELDFPFRDVFLSVAERGVDYYLTLNPAICSRPLRIENPYRKK
jgi:SAM-dependent methyltransferase